MLGGRPGCGRCGGLKRFRWAAVIAAGNFRGAAIYIDGTDVVIVSELSAGWYRYISQWRLGADGTISPRSAGHATPAGSDTGGSATPAPGPLTC